jgi:hypothetical protein
VGIDQGGFQTLVAEQHLNGPQIDAAFEQMGGEAMPLMPSSA